MLEGDPIELAKMILALGDLLQRTLLGRAELEVGSDFHVRRSIQACARRQCGAVAQRHAVARGKGEKPLCPRALAPDRSRLARRAPRPVYLTLAGTTPRSRPCRRAARRRARDRRSGRRKPTRANPSG